MEQTTIPDNMMQEARRYALCIAGEANKFYDFAIAMLDYMGPDFCPYLKELYKELSQILFTRAIPQDNLNDVNNINDEEILSWYESYKAKQKKREEQLQGEFNENIDELQFLVKDCRKREEFQNMLDFVGKFCHMAPYNAMLVEMQKPGAKLVLKGREWDKFNRRVKPNAQKLITLRQFGPVQCMFDISDTEQIPGRPYSKDAEIMNMWDSSLKRTQGEVKEDIYNRLIENLTSYGIYLDDSFNAANTFGGYVTPYRHEIDVYLGSNDFFRHNSRFLISVNRSQSKTEKFHTICHELGHIFCRHMSYNPEKERWLTLKEREFEAETVAWLMCKRHGISNPSEEYLASYAQDGLIPICSTDFIMKSVTEIEKMLKERVYVRKSEWYNEDKSFKSTVDDIWNSIKGKKKKPSRRGERIY